MDVREQAEQAIAVLRRRHIAIQPGLTEPETQAVEQRFGFGLCPVHRAFLQRGLPAGEGWPDWRHGSVTDLQDRLAGPVQGLLFDIEHNGYWPDSWGARPTVDPLAAASAHLATVPQLVPIYAHRYLPAAPAPDPTPVLSVHQSDVICYGRDLVTYLEAEFEGRPRELTGAQPVPFWSGLRNLAAPPVVGQEHP